MKLLQYEKVQKILYLELGEVCKIILKQLQLCLHLVSFVSFWATKNFLPMVPRYVNAIQLKKRIKLLFAEQIIINEIHTSTKDHKITTG